MFKTSAAIALAALVAGCASVQVGKNFDPVAFQSSVKRGETTQADVHRLLGSPVSTGQIVDTNGETFTRWMYYYGKGKPPRFDDVQFKMLEIKFDGEKIVQGFNWSSSEP